MMMNGRLDGRVAIVTGAGSGIGRAIAERYAAEGCSVAVNDYDESATTGTVERITAAGGSAVAAAGDVSSQEQVDRMVEAARSSFGRLDIVVNNAGVFDESKPVVDTGDDDWDRVLAVNLTGPFRLMRAAIPHMIEGGGGAVINVSSIAGLIGGAGGAAYTASKHGLVGLTRQAAVAYAEKGIRVNAICPGAVKTGMLPEEMLDDTENPLIRKVLSAPARRAADPDEIAAVAVFLATDDASFMHGETVTVDGGWVAQA
jgi:3-oxoacyl-[acyl-carrier protein] reductase